MNREAIRDIGRRIQEAADEQDDGRMIELLQRADDELLKQMPSRRRFIR